MSSALPQEKIDECREIFNLYDHKKEGSIPTEHLEELFNGLGVYVPQQDVAEFAGKQSDNKVSFEALIEFIPEYYDPKINAKELINSFAVLDGSGKGTINAEELKHMLTTMGDKLTNEEADALLEKFTDKNGNIDYKKFSNEIAL